MGWCSRLGDPQGVKPWKCQEVANRNETCGGAAYRAPSSSHCLSPPCTRALGLTCTSRAGSQPVGMAWYEGYAAKDRVTS